jgi:hypothetical protein
MDFLHQMLGQGGLGGQMNQQQQQGQMDPRVLQLLRELQMQQRQKAAGFQQGPVGFGQGQGMPPAPPQGGGMPMGGGMPPMAPGAPQGGGMPQHSAGMPTPGGAGGMVNPMGKQGGGVDLQSLIMMLMQQMGQRGQGQ